MSAPDAPRHASDDPLAWLFALQRFGARAGLGTMRELLARLGSPQRAFRTALVGGTNGKGSVARLLAAALQAGGWRTGLFTSPHLQRVGERARVDGEEASAAEMAALVAEVRPLATELGATFFEVVTAVALLRFARAGVERAVLEVGMGGRLDATNAVEPELTVVTGVALDHQGVLGASVAEIAGDKAGILREGVPLVTAATGEALAVLAERAGSLGAPLVRYGEAFTAEGVSSGWEGVGFTLAWRGGGPLPDAGRLELASPLVGRHQVANVAQAAVAALLLGVAPGAVREALATARWPGRLERCSHRGRHVVLDGAHNPQAAQALAVALQELEGRVAVLVVGVSEEKDVDALLRAWHGLARRVLFTRAERSPRAATPETLLAAWRAGGGAPPAATAPGPAAALAAALDATAPGDTIVVAGSLFLVGEARDLLEGKGSEPFERWQ